MKKERVKTGEMEDTETMSVTWFCAIVIGRHLWEKLGVDTGSLLYYFCNFG